MKRCDICIEENCQGAYNCRCETCNKYSDCYRFLRATIRITTKCTQQCSHCAFNCSPTSNDNMTIHKAKQISEFLKNNNIRFINVMGGEFFMNKYWYSILLTLGESVSSIRLVSNGDWINNITVKNKLITLKNKLQNKLNISISKDRWHNNLSVTEAEKFLLKNKFNYNIGNEENDNEDVIIPIGRSAGEYNVYSSIMCYCHNTKNIYSFLIDENGEVYKCIFGVWNYANIQDYIKGSFNKRFKEFNKKFYAIFITSCSNCIQSATHRNRTVLQNKNKGENIRNE